jgi:hypothetical protein
MARGGGRGAAATKTAPPAPPIVLPPVPPKDGLIEPTTLLNEFFAAAAGSTTADPIHAAGVVVLIRQLDIVRMATPAAATAPSELHIADPRYAGRICRRCLGGAHQRIHTQGAALARLVCAPPARGVCLLVVPLAVRAYS